MIVLLNVEALEAEWLGPNLVTNGDFSAGGANWSGGDDWSFTNGQVRCHYSGETQMTQMVSFEPYKRYRISGQGSPGYYDAGVRQYHSGQIRIEAFGQFATDWWGPDYSQTLTTKTAEGILPDITCNGTPHAMFFMLNGKIGWGAFDNVGMYKVVYSPQINISQKQNGVRINSNAPSGSSASISVNLNNSTPYADELTSWSMNWGDGVIESNPTFNSHSHTYSITSGNSQTWASTFSGTNQAGTVFDNDTVTILRQPDIALMVNSLSVMNGETVAINIFDNPTLNLSLLNSKGYLEGASFQIDGKLNQSGSDLLSFLYSGNLFNQSDIGHIYTLTSGVYNTGLGVNSDYLSINLSIVPEPCTLSFLGLGAVIVRRKRS